MRFTRSQTSTGYPTCQRSRSCGASGCSNLNWSRASRTFAPMRIFLPPPKMICSPYDVDATYGRKLTTWWVGYKVHLTESCDEDSPRLITHVETSREGLGDVDVTPLIHQARTRKGFAPQRAPD